ncbi:Protein Rf1 mitochondrial, partial [Bienertia sinuspersici]
MVDKARAIFEYMIKKGQAPDIITYNVLIDGYCLRVTYNILIDALCKDSRLTCARRLFKEMKAQAEAVKPD